ncbi:ATP-binding protein [Nakamurella sp. A5-74]|uniref:Sensor-like histidine kinase SenX3 n=1 Tax=Nakamurella sp. A5-74 TaxID=3158264 RepID=A0AAU8DM35_9ACTN
MPWVGYLAVGVAGLLIGWLLAAMLIRRADALREDPVPADAELAAEVVRNSDTGFVVTDLDGNVLLSNARAVELRAVRAGMCDSRIAAAIERTVISGEPIDVELGHLDPPPAGDADAVVRAVVEPLAQEWVLISVVDESAARQVETIRRDFVANVSHELKTPVGAMALLAEAVLDAADDEEAVRHFSAKMLREATRLGALVGELIALSRLQGGIHVQDLAVVEIDGVISESIGRLATSAESAGIDVVTDTPSGLLVRGDRTLLVTALTNLIDNAISYSPAHTSVSVARRRTADGIQISVTDRGVGIAPEHQRRVFERFFRVDPARSRSTGGTGLGLAIVKHVAANHGGRALLWSKVGTGSTFTLQLPALAGDDPGADTAHPVGPARLAALTPAVRTEGAS